MGQKSSIDTRLSAEDKAALNNLIAGGDMSLDGMIEWLGEKGYEISRSALHRHATKFEKAADRLRRSRQIVESMSKELGEAAIQGEQGRMLVEMAHTFVFDMMIKLDDDETLDPKSIMMLGKGLSDLVVDLIWIKAVRNG